MYRSVGSNFSAPFYSAARRQPSFSGSFVSFGGIFCPDQESRTGWGGRGGAAERRWLKRKGMVWEGSSAFTRRGAPAPTMLQIMIWVPFISVGGAYSTPS